MADSMPTRRKGEANASGDACWSGPKNKGVFVIAHDTPEEQFSLFEPGLSLRLGVFVDRTGAVVVFIEAWRASRAVTSRFARDCWSIGPSGG